MKILVVGHRGMLGSEVVKAAQARGHELVLGHEQAEAIINCAGKLPGSEPIEMILANSTLPYHLAEYGIPVVHMSTDCVYSGRAPSTSWIGRGDLPSPTDTYGRSKLTGEVQAPHVTNVRGSFIGLKHGFLRWLLDARGVISAWKNAFWNGTTVDQMALQLVLIAESHSMAWLGKTVNVATEDQHSKAELVKHIVEKLNLPVSIELTDNPKINRRLNPDIILESIYPHLDKLLAQVCLV